MIKKKTFKQNEIAVYDQAFIHNAGGYAATIAVSLFVIVIAFSLLQYQALRARGDR